MFTVHWTVEVRIGVYVQATSLQARNEHMYRTQAMYCAAVMLLCVAVIQLPYVVVRKLKQKYSGEAVQA